MLVLGFLIAPFSNRNIFTSLMILVALTAIYHACGAVILAFLSNVILAFLSFLLSIIFQAWSFIVQAYTLPQCIWGFFFYLLLDTAVPFAIAYWMYSNHYDTEYRKNVFIWTAAVSVAFYLIVQLCQDYLGVGAYSSNMAVHLPNLWSNIIQAYTLQTSFGGFLSYLLLTTAVPLAIFFRISLGIDYYFRFSNPIPLISTSLFSYVRFSFIHCGLYCNSLSVFVLDGLSFS